MRYPLLLAVALVAAVGSLFLAPGAALAGKEGDNNAATDLFVGTATTGAGQASPVDVNPNDIRVRGDGAIGLGYTYRAVGQAEGDVEGRFTYEEHGYLFFRNPADPTTFVGSVFVSGVFSLNPEGRGPIIRIADSCPSCYQSGVRTVAVKDLPKEVRKSLDFLLGKKSEKQGKGNDGVTLGYFTFTNNHGTFTGYASPDFRRFVIAITFDRPAGPREGGSK